MKLKSSFFYTIREDVKDEDSKSGKLLVRSGMVKKSGNGIYTYMPLGFKVLKKIEAIVREEMDAAGAQELIMPSLLPEEVYITSGRRDIFGHDMFSLKDRFGRDYVLGPTHEELFVMAAKEKVRSYKDLPFNLYQMANKYRDEPRPRYGLIRVREFVMKDAYSFDSDLEGLEISYQKMVQAYKNIFDRIGVDYKIVRADTGAMGGLLSEEFQAVTDIGEDVLVLCNHCEYASNIEVSECLEDAKETKEALLEKELLYTPNVGTIADLEDLGIDIHKLTKTLIYKIDDQFYACMVAGNRDVNELKIQHLLHAKSIALAEPEEVEQLTHASLGFAGPIGLTIPVIIDYEVKHLHNFLVGANQTDYHYTNVNVRDFEYQICADIRNVAEGDRCPHCGGTLYFKKGIEIGNTFKLGTKYSESLDLRYLDQNNQLQPVVMGCYGIGIGRILAALTEQQADEKGLSFPINIAPYPVGIVVINEKEEAQITLANQLYDAFLEEGIEPLFDDRDLRPGVKFNDMDLIGLPIRIVVGKKAVEGIVELKMRKEEVSSELPYQDAVQSVVKQIKTA